jgi:Ni/Co efflux regulator RcnB
MQRRDGLALSLAAALALTGGAATAQPDQHRGGPAGGRVSSRAVEPHAGPVGYQRVQPPRGWNSRPNAVDRGAYQHNFQAARSYSIGPYHPARGWTPRRWVYGQILPRAFWAPQYILADYWLFALEVPPVGCEWVRYGNDALLVDIATGEILQVEYGVFA